MKVPPTIAAVLVTWMVFGAEAARSDPAAAGPASVSETAGAPSEPPPGSPRLKLSYRRFSISNLDLSHVPLSGAALDGAGVDVRYGLIGLGAGLQYAAPVTPFVEGRLVGGILSGNIDGSLAVAAATSSPAAAVGSSATTFMYGRGIDAGAEIFAIGRAYVSLSIGWLHTTWHGIDYAAVVENPSAHLRAKDLSADSFTFKLGIGI